MSSNEFKELITVAASKEYESIFGESYPSTIYLENIYVKKTSTYLDFYAPLKGMKTPKRWLEKSYDYFRFRIYLVRTKSIKIENLPANGCISFLLEKNRISLESSSKCSLKIQYEELLLAKIEGYEEGNE
ncbi:hypothetical protein [Pseudomonas rhizoryzae]|uniref:hypothetical protein n=1 Tax=Pseudomonas rhizoryzae TaxID=2571129 RepID=UPI0010C21C41|nr:hypothetical protein [Pseudomonas rhizoryzae]